MALEIGADQAQDIGNIHEECAKMQPPAEASMDLFNNAIGRGLASTAKSKSDCEASCLSEALSGGSLQTSPGGTPPPAGPYPYPYPSPPKPRPPIGPVIWPVPIFGPGAPVA